MYCKNCGAQLGENASVCLQCGKTVANSIQVKAKKPIFKRWWFWAIIAVVVIAIGTSGGEKPEKVGTVDGGLSHQQDVQNTPTVYSVGDTLEMNGVLVTLNDVYESTGSQYSNPEQGNVFVICEFTIENKNDYDLAVSSLLSFNGYFDSYLTDVSYNAIFAEENKKQLDGSVGKDKKIRGIIGFEVSKDWKELEVSFNPDVFDSDAFVFNYSK